MHLIANSIRISLAKLHRNRLTTVQDIQDYTSLIFFWGGGTTDDDDDDDCSMPLSLRLKSHKSSHFTMLKIIRKMQHIFLIMDANGGYCPMPSCHTFFESSRRADVKLSLTRNVATYRFRDIRDEMAF